ncbi:phage holin family protein [Candidatus Daviesbacteria bacterium]|nr:phage holin family protein [Candidatus Daviesbacteria bacterium]
MKSILRNFLINLASLTLTARLIPGLVFDGGFKTLAYSAVIFMFINILIVPILKIMFLPLNILTLGIFSWAINVLALYILTSVVPQLKLVPYTFPGATIQGVIIPQIELNVLYVAIVASFMIGFTSHLLHWLAK